MAEHTPGPWRSDSPYVSAPSGAHRKIVADCYQDPSWRDSIAISDDECIANAHLIAAAPELLAALGETVSRFERCIVHAGSDPEFAREAVKAARAVIAKARGEADPKSEDEEEPTDG